MSVNEPSTPCITEKQNILLQNYILSVICATKAENKSHLHADEKTSRRFAEKFEMDKIQNMWKLGMVSISTHDLMFRRFSLEES